MEFLYQIKEECVSVEEYADMLIEGLEMIYSGEYVFQKVWGNDFNETKVLKITGSLPNGKLVFEIPVNDYYNCMIQQGKDRLIAIMEISTKINLLRNDNKNLKEFLACKECIVVSLVNRDMNKELLAEIPYLEFHEFAIIYRIDTDYENILENRGLITREDLRNWDLNIKELHEMALKNSEKILQKQCINLTPVCEECGNVMEEHPMYAVTNRKTYMGASVILYPDVLDEIGEWYGDSYYLLPSSIHEWIVVRASDLPYESAVENVKDVNDTGLPQEILLGYNVYYYNTEEKRLISNKEEIECL